MKSAQAPEKAAGKALHSIHPPIQPPGLVTFRVWGLGLVGATRDPRFLDSLALLPSESPVNTGVSLVSPITSSPQFYLKLSCKLLGIRRLHRYLWVFVALLRTFDVS